MGKYLYSGTMNRWLYNGDINNASTNSNNKPWEYKKSLLFKDGYDDPTYMTFKVEFGDWGASILDRSLIEQGTTVFSPTFADYDELPIGLLKCPLDLQNQFYDSYWQTSTDASTFNNTKLYSAFAYLRSRNEDTRAKYLYYFVNGLFEILKEYPFIFKKISGLQDLEKFDPKSGQRLKTPAKITLECYEGLDLKIRTLLEFYRKAAWDDVYLRWILPENMREFKMIIYVFERRIFLDTKLINVVNNGIGETHMLMSYADLNGDIPIKAYECCPCEFNIGESQSWKGDYEAGWNGNNEETSKIVVEVKNVKTFFKNNLLSDLLSKIYDNNGKPLEASNDVTLKINSIMIYDLVDTIERTSDISINNAYTKNAVSNLTVNGARALFLNKNILLENEETKTNKNNFNYIWGYGEKPTGTNNTNNDYVTTIKNVRKLLLDSAFMEDNMRTSWVYSLGTGASYDPNRSFWENLGDNVTNILTGARKLILMSGVANITMIPNCLIDTFYLPPEIYTSIDNNTRNKFSYNTLSNKSSDLLSTVPLSDITQLELNYRYGNIANASTMNLEFREKYTLDGKIDNPSDNISSISLSDVTRLYDNGRQIDKQTFTDLSTRLIPENLNYIEIDKEREIPELNYNELNSERNIPEQEFRNINNSRLVPEYDIRKLDKTRHLPELEYKELNEVRNLPKLKYDLIENNREIPELKYVNLNTERSLPELTYQELDKERIPDTELMNLLLVARALPGLESVSLDEIRKLPKLELLDLKEAEERSIPSFVSNKSVLLEEISKIDGTNMKLLELDKDNKMVEDNTLEFLKQNSVLETLKISLKDDDDEKTKKLKSIALFTLEFVKNSDNIKKVYVDSILEMKSTLRNVTTEIINGLPKNDTYIVKKGEKDNHNIESALLSQNDVDQINSNMKFLSIKDTDVEKLSFQSLIKIHEDLGRAITQSQAVQGLTKIVKNNVGTELNDNFRKNANKSVLEEPRKKPIIVL